MIPFNLSITPANNTRSIVKAVSMIKSLKHSIILAFNHSFINDPKINNYTDENQEFIKYLIDFISITEFCEKIFCETF